MNQLISLTSWWKGWWGECGNETSKGKQLCWNGNCHWGLLGLSPAGELWEMVSVSHQRCFTQGVKTLGSYSPAPIHHWWGQKRGSDSLLFWSTPERVKCTAVIRVFKREPESGKLLSCMGMAGAEETWVRHHWLLLQGMPESLRNRRKGFIA